MLLLAGAGCVPSELPNIGAVVVESNSGSGGTNDSTSSTTTAAETSSSSTTDTEDASSSSSSGEALEPCQLLHPESIMCDDFEAGVSPRWAQADVDHEQGQAALGDGSVRTITAPGAANNLRLSLDEPIVDGTLAIRDYMRVSADTEISQSSIHIWLMQIPAEGTQRMSLDLRDNQGLMVVAKLDDQHAQMGNLWQPGQWMCVELRIDIDDVDGRYGVWVDGSLVLENSGVDTLPDLGYGRISIGALVPDNNLTDVDIQIDDVVISRGPIGCG